MIHNIPENVDELVDRLCETGAPRDSAEEALGRCHYNVERAAEMLFAENSGDDFVYKEMLFGSEGFKLHRALMRGLGPPTHHDDDEIDYDSDDEPWQLRGHRRQIEQPRGAPEPMPCPKVRRREPQPPRPPPPFELDPVETRTVFRRIRRRNQIPDEALGEFLESVGGTLPPPPHYV
jgi:hypothetical protein